jgi:hypothetical protein
MSAIDLLSQLDDDDIEEISKQIGINPTQTRTAIDAAAPMLLAGAAQTAQQPGGYASVQRALDSQAGVLDNLRDLLRGGGPADGGGLLDGILGRTKPTVQEGVQETTGLNSDQTRRLLAMLAPIVIGMLARRRQNDGSKPLDAQMRDEAQQAEEQARQRSPKIGGILGKILSYAEQQR